MKPLIARVKCESNGSHHLYLNSAIRKLLGDVVEVNLFLLGDGFILNCLILVT